MGFNEELWDKCQNPFPQPKGFDGINLYAFSSSLLLTS
jgi:hypothetical protein